MAARIAGFVNSLQLRLKIESATSSEDDPTPIYLLDETVSMMSSNSASVSDAVDLIQQRLQHRSSTVKQKSLRLIKHAAERGSPELRQAFARKSLCVRNLLHFRCAPDPFKGDIPWKRVQEYAKEALAALHAAPAAQQAPTGPSLEGRIQGFGSGANGSSMMGFGSETGRCSPRTATGGFGGAAGPAAASMVDSLSTGVRDLTGRAMDKLSRPQHSLLQDHLEALEGAGGYSPAGPSAAASQPGSIVHSEHTAPDVHSTAQQSAEGKIVARICAPAGLRMAPASEDLAAFVEASESLDGMLLAELLQEQLENGSWRETLRALCALEALLERSTSPACGEVAVHFQSHPGALRRSAQSAQATVRQRAQRVLRLIGDETLPSGQATAAARSTAADLLGGVIHEAEPAIEPAEAAQAAAHPLDLLAGLDAAPAPASSAAAPAASLSGVDLLASPAAGAALSSLPASSAGGGDIFGDWTASPTATAAQPPHAAVPSASTDMFAGLSVGPPLGSAAASLASQGRPSMADALSLCDLSLGSGSSPGVMRGQPMGSVQGASAPMVRGPTPAAMQPSALPGGTGLGMFPPPVSAAVPAGPGFQPAGDPFAAMPPAWAPPPAAFPSGASAGIGPGLASINGARPETDVLSALHAATSGISSVKREDAAFSFVESALAQAKKR